MDKRDLLFDKEFVVLFLSRFIGYGMVISTISFLLNNYLNYWRDWPGLYSFFIHYQWFEADQSASLSAESLTLAHVQFGFYIVPLLCLAFFLIKTPHQNLNSDADFLSGLCSYFIRACFWSVLLIGIFDLIISFMRLEETLALVFGDKLAEDLGRSQFRGEMVHYPLIAVSFIIACFSRSLGFTWLSLLIVIAEIQIVIARFVFSYEQAFMADLVRFWYGALFLFASAYTLLEEGHVRVDILYSGFNDEAKAWTNSLGALFLGIPLCWIILILGMSGKFSVINGPLLTFEITQQGYGLFVKYWLAVFLMIFAVSMMIQFASQFLKSVWTLTKPPDGNNTSA